MSDIDIKTIKDFGDQWSRYTDNSGKYGSQELFNDTVSPLLHPEDFRDKQVVDIGSGSGRIVGMLLNAGARHVTAVEPSSEAFATLQQNINDMERSTDVECINAPGHSYSISKPADYIVSIGVIHHIPKPQPVIDKAFEALKPGGHIFLWLYGYEGNETYLTLVEPLRKLTTKMPHSLLRIVVEIMYLLLCIYHATGRFIPLPMKNYVNEVLWTITPDKRRLVIYDQLNPSYAKYYRRHEVIKLLEASGFSNIKLHHRHKYSWSAIGQKP